MSIIFQTVLQEIILKNILIKTPFVSYEFYNEYQIEIRSYSDGFLWAIPSLLITGTAPTLAEAKTTAIDYIEENAD